MPRMPRMKYLEQHNNMKEHKNGEFDVITNCFVSVIKKANNVYI